MQRDKNRIAKNILAVGALSLALSACGGGLPGLRSTSYQASGEARLFSIANSNDPFCPHDPRSVQRAGAAEFGGAIVTALVGSLVSKGLERFGTALQEGAEGGELPAITAQRNMMLAPGTHPNCLILVRGEFGDSGTSVAPFLTTDDANVAQSPSGLPDIVAKRLNEFGIDNVVRLDQYIELAIVPASNERAMTFAPVHYQMSRSIDGSSSGERDVTVSLAFKRAGEEKPVGSNVLLGGRRIGNSETFAQSRCPLGEDGFGLPYCVLPVQAEWFGSFHPADPAKKETKKPKSTGPQNDETDPVQNLPQTDETGAVEVSLWSTDKNSVPVTVTATIVETRKTREGLAFVASVFNDVKPKIEEELKPLYDETQRRANETAALTKLAELAGAVSAAEAKLITYCKVAKTDPQDAAAQIDRLTKSQEAYAAQVAANSKAISIGEALPYGPSDILELSELVQSEVNEEQCSKYSSP